MKIYQACSASKIYFELLKKVKAKNVLNSFSFFKTPEELLGFYDGWFTSNLIIDSGAFSAWSRNDKIDIDKYAEFCVGIKKLIPDEVNLNIVNLDVIPGRFGRRPTEEEIKQSAEKGWENMLYLEKKGLKVIHVFHQHEDFKWLDKLMKHSDYIGISPANDVSMKEKANWLNKVFSITKNNIKTHGFAVTSHNQLYRYPFYSVDSSSWMAPSRYGRIYIFNDDLTVKTFQYRNKEDVVKYWDYIKDIGIEKLGSDDYRNRILIALKCFHRLEKIATSLWEKRGIVWKN